MKSKKRKSIIYNPKKNHLIIDERRYLASFQKKFLNEEGIIYKIIIDNKLVGMILDNNKYQEYNFYFCWKCKKWKNVDEFYKNSTKSSGLQDVCKKCKSVLRKEGEQRKLEKYTINDILEDALENPSNPDNAEIIKKYAGKRKKDLLVEIKDEF